LELGAKQIVAYADWRALEFFKKQDFLKLEAQNSSY
jgi:hypothetical protein